MTKRFPCHELLAEPLQRLPSAWTSTSEEGVSLKTHLSNLLQVALGGYPRHLDCDLEATIFALPHVRKPTAGVWYGCWIIGYCDL